jgi:hypothetical protein
LTTLSIIQKQTLSTYRDTIVVFPQNFTIPLNGFLTEVEAWQLHITQIKEDELPVLLELTSIDIANFWIKFFVPYPPDFRTQHLPKNKKKILDMFRLKTPLLIAVLRGMQITARASIPRAVTEAPTLVVKLTVSDGRP